MDVSTRKVVEFRVYTSISGNGVVELLKALLKKMAKQRL